jgi:hypothetical protein
MKYEKWKLDVKTISQFSISLDGVKKRYYSNVL